jgi:hypothetical protein
MIADRKFAGNFFNPNLSESMGIARQVLAANFQYCSYLHTVASRLQDAHA